METILQWKISNDLEIGGGELLIELPGITNKRIKQLFGKLPAGTGIYNDYSDAIIISNNVEKIVSPTRFMDKNAHGIYTLYTSFGEWRIGGFEKNQYVEELKSYIYGK